MPLFDITRVRDDLHVTKESLVKLQRTTFAEQKVQERAHLQAALRDHIDLIDSDLFVLAEEFGDFEGVQRRIDLLCLDRDCRLVVVELKRTADGGHMELQALRYAAMISTMTFAQVVRALAKYRVARGIDGSSETAARTDLLAWLELDEDEEPAVARDVGIVLASEDFSQEITTTVLWLNEFHDLNIRCIRLSPYTHGDRLLLDVQQVIPLPEASVYTVRVREKENASKLAKDRKGADWTKFVVHTPTGVTEPLPKRWAMLRLIEAMAEAGTPMKQVADVIPPSKLLRVEGFYSDSDKLWGAIQEQLGKPDKSVIRWHLADPIVDDGGTWVLHNQWGTKTREFFERLLSIAPTGFAVYEEGDSPQSLS